jgi:hypothetical protein
MADTTLPSSLQIAQAAELRPIAELAEEVGLEPIEIAPYGSYKAKIDLSVLGRRVHSGPQRARTPDPVSFSPAKRRFPGTAGRGHDRPFWTPGKRPP